MRYIGKRLQFSLMISLLFFESASMAITPITGAVAVGVTALGCLSLYTNHAWKYGIKELLVREQGDVGILPSSDLIQEKLLLPREPNFLVRPFLRDMTEEQKIALLATMPGPFHRVAFKDADNGTVVFYKLNPFLWYRFWYNEIKKALGS